MTRGTVIGVSRFFYALLDADPSTGTASYQAPAHIPGVVSIMINPNGSIDTLFADNGPYDTVASLGQISADINLADLTLEEQAVLLGHTLSGGVLVRKSSDAPPWVAIGFESLKTNGHNRWTWLAKGKFSAPEQSNATKADSATFSTPTIKGSFVKRDCDNEWERHTDEDTVDFMSSLGTNWFNSPYGSAADTVAPTITTVAPVANATAVAVNAAIVWTFSEALSLSTVTTGNFGLVNDATGAAISGALSINSSRTIVTFAPTAALTASTAYRAIVTTGVKDLAGNALAAYSVTKFTTV